MNHVRTVCTSLTMAALALAGCSSPQEASHVDAAPIALAEFAPVAEAPATSPAFSPLGAGDALGQEVFRYYVACLRAHEHYATGDSAFRHEQ